MFFLAPTTKQPNIEPLQNPAASFIFFSDSTSLSNVAKFKKKLCPVAGLTCFRLAGLTLFQKLYHYDSLHNNFFSGTSHYFLTSGSPV